MIADVIWAEDNDALRVLVSPSAFARQGDHTRDPASVKKSYQTYFLVRSWIARDLSTLWRPWYSISHQRPYSRSCVGVLCAVWIVLYLICSLRCRGCTTSMPSEKQDRKIAVTIPFSWYMSEDTVANMKAKSHLPTHVSTFVKFQFNKSRTHIQNFKPPSV